MGVRRGPWVMLALVAHASAFAQAALVETPAIDFITRFDSLAFGPFPVSIELPPSEGDSGPGHLATLILTSRLRSAVVFPDDSPATMFAGTLDGHAATITRSAEGMDISVVTGSGVHVTTLGMNALAVEHAYVPAGPGIGNRRQRREPSYGYEGDVEYLGTPPVPMPWSDPLAPIRVRIFLHDELRSSRTREIHAGYVAWWLRDMESNVLPEDVAIEVTYSQGIPGVSDQPYGTPSFLNTWVKAVDRFVASREIRNTWKNKYVLVTANRPSERLLGQAIPTRGIAVASLSGPYSVVAHELGHLFGAEHIDAEWRGWHRWWPCRTNMYLNDAPLLANCYQYSAANIARIQRYVDLKGYLTP